MQHQEPNSKQLLVDIAGIIALGWLRADSVQDRGVILRNNTPATQGRIIGKSMIASTSQPRPKQKSDYQLPVETTPRPEMARSTSFSGLKTISKKSTSRIP